MPWNDEYPCFRLYPPTPHVRWAISSNVRSAALPHHTAADAAVAIAAKPQRVNDVCAHANSPNIHRIIYVELLAHTHTHYANTQRMSYIIILYKY